MKKVMKLEEKIAATRVYSTKILVFALVCLLGAVACGVYHITNHGRDAEAADTGFAMFNDGALTILDLTNAVTTSGFDGTEMPRMKQVGSRPVPKLEFGKEYYIRYELPNHLKAEIENGDDSFKANVSYSFQVGSYHREPSPDPGDRDLGRFGLIEIEILNLDNNSRYLVDGVFVNAGDRALCLKHSMHVSSSYYSGWFDLDDEDLGITLYTGALPDAGPKTTDTASHAGLGASWHIAGTDDIIAFDTNDDIKTTMVAPSKKAAKLRAAPSKPADAEQPMPIAEDRPTAPKEPKEPMISTTEEPPFLPTEDCSGCDPTPSCSDGYYVFPVHTP